MTSNSPGSINQSLCDTASTSFPNLYTLKVPNSTGQEVFAFNGNKDFLQEMNNATFPNLDGLSQVITELKTNLTKYVDTGIRLYDENADVEIRSIRALAELIKEQLDYYLRVFRERGLQGLIEVLMN